MPERDLKDLIRKVQQLRNQGLSFEKMAKALNDKGFTNLEGEPWKRGAVERFYKRTLFSPRPDTKPLTRTAMAHQQRRSLPEEPPQTGSLSGDLTLSDLSAMLMWWKGQPTASPDAKLEHKPYFSGSRKAANLLLNRRLLEMVAARIANTPADDPSSLDRLVEVLLWKFLGSPDRDHKGNPILRTGEIGKGGIR